MKNTSGHYNIDIKKNYRPLSLNEQKELYKKMKAGDVGARDTIANSCLPLVYRMAQKFRYNNKHVDLFDLVQEGNIAMIMAIDKWTGNNSITTVVTTYVRNALIDTIQQARYSMKMKCDPTAQAAIDISKIKKVKDSNVPVISKATGLTEKRVRKLLSIAHSRRIEYTYLNHKLHSSEHFEKKAETSIGGCIADLINLANNHIEDSKDRQIFLCWIRNVNANNKARIVSNQTGACLKDVSSSVRRSKKILKEVFKKESA